MEERYLYKALDDWLVDFKRTSVKASTYDRMRVSLGLMLKYPISDMRVCDILARDIQKYLNRLLDDGYSINTIKKQYVLLTAYFKHAISQGDLITPVYLGVKLPVDSSVEDEYEVKTYSDAEQSRLVYILKTLSHPAYGILLLMLECGLRVGEAQALMWQDIDWRRKAITIKRTYVRLSDAGGIHFIQDSPKSKTSKRTIPMSSTVFEILERLSRTVDRSGLIFGDRNGEACTYETVRYYLRQACERAGVEYKSTHALRHTFATNCYYKGCDVKILSKLLGHAKVSITYDIYIHLYGDALDEMRKIVG